MRTDPTENGGLFIGRRPGTGPIRYRALPAPGSKARRRIDATFAALLILLMTLIGLSYWGPLPLLGLWVGSQVQYLTDSPGTGVLSAFLVVLGSLMFGLVILKQLDRYWILTRRAAGHDQREGALGRIFGVTCLLGAAGFSVWLLLFSGAELAPVGIRF
ncbi:MAG: hypothetical protein NTX07_05590 [Solirubrobacterales bacterium]|nr:hypothetical protein [Solirubrobacterales bacterium]